jgi:hypothetical protein
VKIIDEQELAGMREQGGKMVDGRYIFAEEEAVLSAQIEDMKT